MAAGACAEGPGHPGPTPQLRAAGGVGDLPSIRGTLAVFSDDTFRGPLPANEWTELGLGPSRPLPGAAAPPRRRVEVAPADTVTFAAHSMPYHCSQHMLGCLGPRRHRRVARCVASSADISRARAQQFCRPMASCHETSDRVVLRFLVQPGSGLVHSSVDRPAFDGVRQCFARRVREGTTPLGGALPTLVRVVLNPNAYDSAR